MFLGSFVVLGLDPLEANGGTLLQLLDASGSHCPGLAEGVILFLRFVGDSHWVRPVIPLVSPRCSVGSHFSFFFFFFFFFQEI
uniref:Uncharacterized protein n=1 Tax=Glycine max TaxID=3847 RepID=C6T3A7_SOYBN|nr:unknown [Glycine max]